MFCFVSFFRNSGHFPKKNIQIMLIIVDILNIYTNFAVTTGREKPESQSTRAGVNKARGAWTEARRAEAITSKTMTVSQPGVPPAGMPALVN